MKLSVIICTYNRELYLGSALESIKNQSFDKNEYEIILINNKSTDNTEKISKNFAENNKDLNFRYFIEYNQGLSFARNRGIREAEGEILIFIDDDAFAFTDYLQEIYKFFSENKHIIAGGGRIYPHWESKKPEWMSKYLITLVSAIDLGDKIKLFKNRNFPIGANMAFRKEAFEKYGDFNTNLGRVGKGMQGGEEKDIFYRIRNSGELIAYIPNAKVNHLAPDTRLSMEFIRKQAIEIGKSERIRAKSISNTELIMSYFREILKWMASFMIFFQFLISFKKEQAKMIIRFRFWVSKGLFFSPNI